MSSISSSTSFQSPLVRLQSQLSSDVKAGTIKSTDSDALSAALSSIDTSLSTDKSKGGASRPDPGAVQTKIGGLIDQQVSAGSLTADQATELKQLFSDAAPKAGEGGLGAAGSASASSGAHKAHGHHGPPPPPPSDGTDTASGTDAATSTTGSTTSSTTASTTSSTSDSADLLANFLKQVQSTLADSYSQNGTTTASQTSLLFNISA